MILSDYFLISVVLVIALELLFPYNKLKVLKDGFWTDLIWYFLTQNFLLSFLVFKYIKLFFSYHTFHVISSVPVYGQVIVFLFVFDFIEYWFHRLQHSWGPMWRIHELHHSTTELNWLSGSRQNALELIIGNIIQGSLYACLGAATEAVIIVAVIESISGIFNHSNLHVKTGFLKYFFNSPEMHRVHHINKLDCQFSNYGSKFSVWDWIFGTACVPDEKTVRESEYGLDYKYPRTVIKQLLFTFRKEV